MCDVERDAALWTYRREDPATSALLILVCAVAAVVFAVVVVLGTAAWRWWAWYAARRARAVVDLVTQPLFNAPSHYRGSEYR
jgi:hypothetical protein